MNFLIMIALLPAIAMLVYIYKKDGVEHEPLNVVLKYLGFGALSVIPAIILEMILQRVLYSSNPYMAAFLEAFCVAALVEECCKYFFLRRCWNEPAFDYQFDAIVYAVTVSLGFAAIENIEYVLQYGPGTAMVRAVTSIPGHAIFGVFMGYFFGMAKFSESVGSPAGVRFGKIYAVVVPILLHGTYDFFAMSMNFDNRFTLPFFAFLALLYLLGWNRVNRSAKSDRRIVGKDSEIDDFISRFGHL